MNFLSMTEAAAKLGLSRKRIYDFIKENRLPAEKIGATYVIREEDLKLIGERKTGRPPKVKLEDEISKSEKDEKLKKVVKKKR